MSSYTECILTRVEQRWSLILQTQQIKKTDAEISVTFIFLGSTTQISARIIQMNAICCIHIATNLLHVNIPLKCITIPSNCSPHILPSVLIQSEKYTHPRRSAILPPPVSSCNSRWGALDPPSWHLPARYGSDQLHSLQDSYSNVLGTCRKSCRLTNTVDTFFFCLVKSNISMFSVPFI